MAQDYIIREATPDDAEALIAFMKRIADEPNNGTTFTSADEFTRTVDEERDLIRQRHDADNACWLVAVTPDGQLIGQANISGGPRAGKRTVGLAIALAPEWRNRGIGTAMIRQLIDYCRQSPAIHRLELGVYTNNPRAIHVYEKLGFEHEGVDREAFWKANEGGYLDSYRMAILFDDAR